MILIVTVSGDPTADFVAEKMKERSIQFHRIDADLVYQQGTVTICPADNRWVINQNDDGIASEEIGVVWQRRLPRLPFFKHDNPYAEEYVNREWILFWEWWINAIPSNRILDPEWKIKNAANKFVQLEVAHRLGLRIPKTVVTSNPSEAKHLMDTHRGGLVAKTMGGFAKMVDEEKTISGIIYTTPIESVDLVRIETLKICPAIFQEKIEKDYEVRVTLVGEQLFACKIESQRSQRAKVDWRRYDFPNVPHSATELPEEITDKLLRVAKAFEVHFASFDLAVTPAGEYIFFEMNPNSQWVWIEELTGLPITDALISLLVKKVCG